MGKVKSCWMEYLFFLKVYNHSVPLSNLSEGLGITRGKFSLTFCSDTNFFFLK